MTLSLVSTPSVPSEVLVHPLMDGWDSCQGAGLQPQCGARPLVQAGVARQGTCSTAPIIGQPDAMSS